MDFKCSTAIGKHFVIKNSGKYTSRESSLEYVTALSLFARIVIYREIGDYGCCFAMDREGFGV